MSDTYIDKTTGEVVEARPAESGEVPPPFVGHWKVVAVRSTTLIGPHLFSTRFEKEE
jgi:hypothetical protein